MFDELRCEYPLPDGFDPAGHRFQTKDLDQELACYVLQADGSLLCEATGERVPFHGLLTFYATNMSGSGPRGCITSDDAPPWWAEYAALYDHGTLLKIEGAKVLYTDRPHIARAAFFAKEPVTEESR